MLRSFPARSGRADRLGSARREIPGEARRVQFGWEPEAALFELDGRAVVAGKVR